MVQVWVMVLLPLPRIMVTALPQMMFMLMLVSWVRAMLTGFELAMASGGGLQKYQSLC